MNRKPPRCDIFCKVIDNFGDAAVCWRLSRQLCREHGWEVRLLIDRPDVLDKLVPNIASEPVIVEIWNEASGQSFTNPAAIVIESFGCDLPQTYIDAMVSMAPQPLWLNFEYLTAESWVDDCHGLESRHPQLPLKKYFFFPGFSAKTGGLLREADYEQRRKAFDPDNFRHEFGLLGNEQEATLTISLFSYPTPLLPQLISAWADSPLPINALLPGSADAARKIGSLTLCPLPFLPQQRYDELLWLSDINFVRGEDSFVRAQLAGKPLVWHIYPQDEFAHIAKMDAFLQRYPAGRQIEPLWKAWNLAPGALPLQPAWRSFISELPGLNLAAKAWQQTLTHQTDLASQLVKLYRERLE
jgi:uncharacterized repeat protein (TIGR03837 family)